MTTPATTDAPPAPGTPTPTPGAPAVPPSPDPTLAEVSKQLGDLSKKVDDQQRYIRDLETKNATLEARLSHTQQPPADPAPVVRRPGNPLVEVFESAATDPAAAADKMQQHIEREKQNAKAETYLETTKVGHLDNLAAKHPELVKLRMQPAIAIEIGKRMQTKQSQIHSVEEEVAVFKQVADEVFAEFQTDVDQVKAPPKPPTPQGAQGEEGGNRNPNPPAPPQPVATQSDEVAERAKTRMARGL